MQCPILAMPIGLTKAGVPVGIQLIAKPFAEPTLLAAAAAYEQAHPQVAAMVPLLRPRRLQHPVGVAVDGPRTEAEAVAHAAAEGASFGSLLAPTAAGSPFFPVSVGKGGLGTSEPARKRKAANL